MKLRNADARTAAQAAAERRALVLSHPEIAKRLTGLGYSVPENWGGYVPPEFDSTGKRNDSPWRALLVGIIADAEKEDEDRGEGLVCNYCGLVKGDDSNPCICDNDPQPEPELAGEA